MLATAKVIVVETFLLGSRAYSPQIGLRNIWRSAPRFWRCDAMTSAMSSLLTRPVTTSGDSAPASRCFCSSFRSAGQSRTPGIGPATTYSGWAQRREDHGRAPHPDYEFTAVVGVLSINVGLPALSHVIRVVGIAGLARPPPALSFA